MIYSNFCNELTKLKNEYKTPNFSTSDNAIYSRHSIISNGFIGSQSNAILTAEKSIEINGPGCIAAKNARLVASQTILLGTEQTSDKPSAVRFYVPEIISIATTHLKIGNLDFVATPTKGFIICKQLTFLQDTEDEPAAFEIVKSWVRSDQTGIETLSRVT